MAVIASAEAVFVMIMAVLIVRGVPVYVIVVDVIIELLKIIMMRECNRLISIILVITPALLTLNCNHI